MIFYLEPEVKLANLFGGNKLDRLIAVQMFLFILTEKWVSKFTS
jgi:hypothetical protein